MIDKHRWLTARCECAGFKFLIAALAGLFAPPMMAASYQLYDLGTFGGGSYGYAVNENRVATGFSQDLTGNARAFRYTFDSGDLHDLGTFGGPRSMGRDINNAGLIAGGATVSSGQLRAFLHDGALHDLGTFGGSESTSLGVNAKGQVTGYADVPGDYGHAFYYDGGTMHDIGTLGGETSSESKINESGHITGVSNNSQGFRHAFYYDGASMHDIGTLGGSESEGWNINSSDVIVGSALDSDGSWRAFLYSATGMRDLGTLGGTASFGRSLNDYGEAVGYSSTSAGAPAAYYYDGYSMYDLCALSDCIGSGWNALLSVYDINNSGDIVGFGHIDGKSHAFLAVRISPVPGAASGDINDDGSVDLRDLLLMLDFVMYRVQPDTHQAIRADVAPRMDDGAAAPNGIIDTADLMVLQRLILNGSS